MSYRSKLSVAIILPLYFVSIVCLTIWVSFAGIWPEGWPTVLAGAALLLILSFGISLALLSHLLHPLVRTSRALREYRSSRKTGGLPVHHRDIVGMLMADVSETLIRLEQMRRSFEYLDEATGLPNRKSLIREVDRRKSSDSPFRLCVIRLDNYQQVAENLDLKSAEHVAIRTSMRLQNHFQLHHIYRTSHRDFIILYPIREQTGGSSDCDQALQLAVAECTLDIAFASVVIGPAVLAGTAQYPDDGTDADDLIDCALGAATSSSPETRISFHTPGLRKAGRDRLHAGHDLRSALANSEFVLYYQPVIDLARGAVVGAEALIRWQHPVNGLTFPDKFIPEAEKTGAIDAIGLWVLSEACRQVQRWEDQGLPALKVAINLSARQFLDPHLIESVVGALAETGIPGERLEIELTETATMADEAYTRSALSNLKDLGVSTAIDDFGTGYASLSCLRKLPFDKLKIDREFVTDVHLKPDSQAICAALIALAHGLDLRILAEGAETAEEIAFLAAQGCDLFQGYYFSKAVPAADFARDIDSFSEAAKAMKARIAARNAIRQRKLGIGLPKPVWRKSAGRQVSEAAIRKTTDLHVR